MDSLQLRSEKTSHESRVFLAKGLNGEPLWESSSCLVELGLDMGEGVSPPWSERLA
jgi:hypothetical protein